MIDVARLAEVARNVRGLSVPLPFPTPTPTTTLAYAPSIGSFDRLVDVYLPDEPTGTSVVIVHGGGFVLGARDMKLVRVLVTDLLADGVTIASIDWRLANRSRLPGMIDDVALALSWWRDRVGGLGLREDRVVALGLSAGGALAHLASQRLPGSIDRLIGVFPLVDPRDMRGLGPKLLGRWLVPAAGKDFDFGPGPEVPYAIVHGALNRIVPIAQIEGLVRRRVALGLPAELFPIDGAGHGFLTDALSAPALEGRAIVRSLVAAA